MNNTVNSDVQDAISLTYVFFFGRWSRTLIRRVHQILTVITMLLNTKQTGVIEMIHH